MESKLAKRKNNNQPNPKAENRRIFEDARDHLNEASLKNTEQLDKAILSLSSAGLALSLSFAKFIQPIDDAQCINLLKVSWLCFSLAIVSTIIAFVLSNSAIAIEREHIFKYYIDEDDEYATKKNYWGIATYWINRISALSFISAILSMVTYVWLNT